MALAGGPRMIVIGEVLLGRSSRGYLIGWTITFRPSVRTPAGGGLFLAGAVLGGLGGLVLLAAGIAALLPKASAPALGATIVGGVSAGALSVYASSSVADGGHHRAPADLVWATSARCRDHVAYGRGAEGAGGVGLDCRDSDRDAGRAGLLLVFYRLDPIAAYWIGMVPLAVDGVVAATLAAVVMLTRVR